MKVMNKKIALLGDSKGDLEAMRKTLKSRGLHLQPYHAKAAESMDGLVLHRAKLTREDLRICKRLKALPAPPVILAISQTDQHDLDRSFHYGIDGWLPAGTSPDAIARRLNAMLHLHTQQRNLQRRNGALEKRLAQEYSFGEIMTILSSSRDYRAIIEKKLPLVIERAMEALDADVCRIIIYPDIKDIYSVAQTHHHIRAGADAKQSIDDHGRCNKIVKKDARYSYIYEPRKNQVHFLAGIAIPRERYGQLYMAWRGDLQDFHPNTGLALRICAQIAIVLESCMAYHTVQTLARERGAAAEKLLEQNMRLKELDAMKSEFVSMVSHELRTPLASIKGFADNLAEEIDGALNETQKRGIRRIQYQTDRLSRLINDVLDLSKMDAGQYDLKRTRFSLKDLLRKSMEAFMGQAQPKRITLKLRYQAGTTTIDADSDRIAQIIANLLNNAIKFTPERGGIEISCVDHVATGETPCLEIRVADTGPGIPGPELEKIFDRFYQVESNSTRPTGGTGMGLTICRELVTMHGGTIWAENAPQGGAVLCFTLPISPDDASDTVRILVVDDEPQIRELLTDVLQDADFPLHEVITAKDGQHGLEVLAEKAVHVIFTDLNMPRMNGLKFVRIVRKIYPEIAMIVITGNMEQYDIDELLDLGVKDYLKKPFNLTELKLILQRHTTNRHCNHSTHTP